MFSNRSSVISRGCFVVAAAVLAVAAAAGVAGTASAAVIYQDNFPGSSANPLNGSHPAIDLTGAAWSAGSYWKANGSATGSSEQVGAVLPVAVSDGGLYTLTATVAPGSPAAGWQWIALGFVSDPTGETAGLFGSSGPWMLQEPNSNSTAGDLGQYFASGNGNISGYQSPESPVTMTVVLNTMASQWTAQWYYNGTAVQSSPYVYSSNPTAITDVGFATNYNSASVSGFSLTGPTVPETAPLDLLAVGGLGLLLLSGRKWAAGRSA